MSHPDPSIERVIQLVKQLPVDSQHTLLSVLNAELKATLESVDGESQKWLEADLGEDLSPYEWGAGDVPEGKPVQYVLGRGLVVEGSKDFAD
jgi:hypothetical protein